MKLGAKQHQQVVFRQKSHPGRSLGVHELFVVISLDGDHRNARALEQMQNILSLAQVVRFHLRAVKQIAGEKKHVRLLAYGFLGNKPKCRHDVIVRQPAVQPPSPQMDVSRMVKLHRLISSADGSSADRRECAPIWRVDGPGVACGKCEWRGGEGN